MPRAIGISSRKMSGKLLTSLSYPPLPFVLACAVPRLWGMPRAGQASACLIRPRDVSITQAQLGILSRAPFRRPLLSLIALVFAVWKHCQRSQAIIPETHGISAIAA